MGGFLRKRTRYNQLRPQLFHFLHFRKKEMLNYFLVVLRGLLGENVEDDGCATTLDYFRCSQREGVVKSYFRRRQRIKIYYGEGKSERNLNRLN